MDRFEEVNEFIIRSEKDLQGQIFESFKEDQARNKRYNEKNKNNPKSIESRKKYQASDRGRICQRRQYALYSRRVREHAIKLTWFERLQIQKFYAKTPKGFHVDHIIPLSRGGIHCMANLQYLSSKENQKKFNNFDMNDILKYIRNKFIRIRIGYVRDLTLRKTYIIEGGIYFCAFQIIGGKK